LKTEFRPTFPLVVHWDGKLLCDLTGKDVADSLPVVVSGTGVEQLLGVPNLPSDTRDGQATAVAKVLQEWRNSSGMVNHVYAMMSTNTGHRNGSCMPKCCWNRNWRRIFCI